MEKIMEKNPHDPMSFTYFFFKKELLLYARRYAM